MRHIGVDIGLGDSSPLAVAIIGIKDNPKPNDFPLLLAHHEWYADEMAPSYDWYGQCRSLVHEMMLYLMCEIEYPAGLPIGIEFAHTQRNRKVALQLATMWGMVAYACGNVGMRVNLLQPAEGKKALTGDGKAGEEKMIAFAQQMFKTPMSVHQAHAAGLAIATYTKGLK